MRPLTFCESCRGIEVGWNRRYVKHYLVCVGGIARSLRILAYGVSAAFVVSIFPTGAGVTSIVDQAMTDVQETVGPILDRPIQISSDPTVEAVEDLLGRYSRIDRKEMTRIARAVVASAGKHDVDPFLIVSILLVESSGDRFAISDRDAVGIMQIHVPTWGSLVDAEGVNLFLIEDNIDLGTRILKDYTVRYGLWEGVSRYLGSNAPTDEALAYVRRVQGIYGDRQAD